MKGQPYSGFVFARQRPRERWVAVISSTEPRLIVATGGIGSGITLALNGNATLGREESRAAVLLESRDYCKLHIVSHYLQTLLGRDFPIIPVGKVGADAAGPILLDDMRQIGLDLRHVKVVTGKTTLFAVCYIYPNGDGGNLTTQRSASDDVSLEDIRALEDELEGVGSAGIALALPEVPLESRAELLRLATQAGFLRVAAFVTGEAPAVLSSGMLESVDLLALNLDEARAFASIPPSVESAPEIVHRSMEGLLLQNDHLSLVITAGRHGSWTWDGESLQHTPAPEVAVLSTAGAGDAHLAGVVAALAHGVGLHDANRFASIISAMKVGSVHTINQEITAATVLEAARNFGILIPNHMQQRLNEVAAERLD
ncbi:carbohydrate kinase family protein [Cryobacterium psychrotolerans]|nr:carbohydrate kinase family protein [Cryobacterium psychrotolerans]